VQDDSGIPLRYFTFFDWDVALYGVYDKPIKLFASFAQSDLKKSMKEKSLGALPFSYGYNFQTGTSNLFIAEKKQEF
jgi:hypothetical protein